METSKIDNVYSILLVLSAISIFIGSILLIGKIPTFLTISTFIVIFILLVLAVLISKGYSLAIDAGGILGIISIISSATSKAHYVSLLKFGSSIYLSVLDILMIFGFYLFPVIYIYFWIVGHLKNTKKKETK